MKRRILILLALIAALALVASACGDDDDDTATDDDTTTTTEETTDTSEQETTTTAEETTTSEEEETAPTAAEEQTIVDVAVASGEFPTLVAALQATGLDETLAGEGPFTVFAPTEDAFAAALTALDVTAEELLADPDLSDILTYHVLPIAAPAADVLTLDGQEVETVNGATVLVTVDGTDVKVNEAMVVQTDIEASNGVIHVIDTVLLPPSS
jgi:uncharacterized surface protein with fasciclin (FAS1) repeats